MKKQTFVIFNTKKKKKKEIEEKYAKHKSIGK